MRLDFGCHPEPFALIEASAFPKPWSARNFSSGGGKLFFSLWDDEICHAYLHVVRVLEEAEIMRIATRKNERRRGLARRLINAMIDTGRGTGLRRIFLEVSEKNGPAIRLYQATGFQVTGRRPDYYGPDQHALLMTREIFPE